MIALMSLFLSPLLLLGTMTLVTVHQTIVSAWINQPANFHNLGTQKVATGRSLHTRIFSSISDAAVPLGRDDSIWKSEGERIIRAAAIRAGANEKQITIQWKPGNIIVVVDGSVCLSGDVDDDSDDVEFDEGFDDDFDEDFDGDEDSNDNIEVAKNDEKLDLVAIARSINKAFDEEPEGSTGFSIAVHHSIEVTTPGAPDELQGIMFESYKGFDVIAELLDPKKGTTKKVEGKLVERTDELTILNEKGRMRKLKNELVKSVKLPKAKKEKGKR